MGSDARQGQDWWRWVCAWSAAAALGCGERAPVCDGPRCEELDVHVLTWWRVTDNGPAAPLVDAAKQQPGVNEVFLRERDTKNAMMDTVESLLLGGESTEQVDTFLANPGRDVLRWTPCGGEGSSELLLRLDGEGAYPDLRASFDPAVLAGLTCCASASGCSEPGIYAVPLGLHQVNHIFFNVERFDLCPVTVKDATTLIELLSCLGRDGKRVISVPASSCETECALGEPACSRCHALSAESVSYLLESLALLVHDAPLDYQSRWPGQSWPGTAAATLAPLLSNALALLEGQLQPFVNNCSEPPCTAPVDVETALAEVKNGTAAFVVMPDWYSLDAQRTSHGKLHHGPFPGTEDTLLFMTDVFAIPHAGTPGASVEAGFRWLDTLLDLEVQRTFARRKTARAARDDLSQWRLEPALETQLPVSVNPAEVRASLNQWLLALKPNAPATVFANEPSGRELGDGQLPDSLPVAPCAGPPCGEP